MARERNTGRRALNPSVGGAADEIRERIFKGVYGADALLSEKRLSEELRFSRMAIRQAVARLEKEQLVQIIPKVGTRVRSLSFDEVRQILSIRLALESFVAWSL